MDISDNVVARKSVSRRAFVAGAASVGVAAWAGRATAQPKATITYWNGLTGADTVLFYAPMALGPGNPNTVYLGTDRLYRSTDRGTTNTIVSQASITNSGARCRGGLLRKQPPYYLISILIDSLRSRTTAERWVGNIVGFFVSWIAVGRWRSYQVP